MLAITISFSQTSHGKHDLTCDLADNKRMEITSIANKSSIFAPEYLSSQLMPTLDRLYNEKSEHAHFQLPDNSEELDLSRHFSTIREKLELGAYVNPREYIDDVWLIFNNVWLSNDKTSKVINVVLFNIITILMAILLFKL